MTILDRLLRRESRKALLGQKMLWETKFWRQAAVIAVDAATIADLELAAARAESRHERELRSERDAREELLAALQVKDAAVNDLMAMLTPEQREGLIP